MANRRMFSKDIVNSDDFLSLSIGAQVLYFHLVMNADNRGYINQTRRTINSLVGVGTDELNELVGKRFVLKRAENLYLIKGWYIHNDIPTHIGEETNYLEDLQKLCFDENYAYTEKETAKKVAETIKKPLKENKNKKKSNRNRNENEIEIKSKDSLVNNIYDDEQPF